ncbi:MAG: hypothetical protein MRK01_01640 [Candidatus Scalindua sp.]|nr:hypothetical protein [Candidatus Scalindua sp.]
MSTEIEGGAVKVPVIPGGFVLVGRVLQDKRIWDNAVDVKVFLWCLFRANYKTEAISHRGHELKTGQFVYGRFEAARDLKLNPNTFYESIKRLVKYKAISKNGTNKFTIVTVCKYGAYQEYENYTTPTKHQQNTNKTPAKHQQNTTKKEVKRSKKKFKEVEIKTAREKTARLEKISLPKNLTEKTWLDFLGKLKSVNQKIGFKDCQSLLKKTAAVLEKGGDPGEFLSGYVKRRRAELVYISSNAYQSLVRKYGADNVVSAIEDLDGYMRAHGKKYKDHAAAVGNFIRSDIKKGKIVLNQGRT